MASRSLGTLTLDLIARIGGFTRGMTEAERASDRSSREISRKNQQRAKEVERAWNNATKFIAGAFAGLSVAGLFRSFIQESVDAQNEQAQLAAVLRSTGEAAGFSADQLNRMASEMAGKSIFSEGDINRAQTRLLSYTGIVGEQFPQAMQAVIDMAARMGMSVEQSAETIGRALDIPSQGLTALTRQGFRFTEEQKKAAEELERTGRVAEAQAIVLEALKSAYDGSAEAARNTLGGAVLALREQLKTLMTGSDGSIEGARGAIEELTRTMASPETKAGFAALTGGIAEIIRLTVGMTAGFTNFAQFLGQWVAQAIHGSADPIERLDEKIKELDGDLNRVNGWLRVAAKDSPAFIRHSESAAKLADELARARKERDALVFMANNTASPRLGSSGPAGGGVRPPSPEEQARLAAQAAARESAKRAAQQAAQQAQAYLENLKRQLQATENLSVAETVLRDIQEGRLKLAGGVSKEQLLTVARQIDAARELTRAEEDRLKAMQSIAQMQAQIDDRAVAEADALMRDNQALRDEIELIGKEGEALLQVELARNAANLARAEEALLQARNVEASATEITSLERQIELLKQRSGLIKDRAAAQQAADDIKQQEQFYAEAYKNIQSGFGQTFMDMMNGNFKNIGDGFVQLINRMVAEALAADLMNVLFGQASKSGGRSGGLLGDLFSGFIGSIFGGGLATGGPALPGMFYEVNENGPEMLEMGGRQYLMMGDQMGKVIPNTGSGRAVNQNNNFFVQGRIDRDTENQIAAKTGRAVQRASRLTA